VNRDREDIDYIIENLKAVYGVPNEDSDFKDPLDVLILAILSQATTNTNSDRTFFELKRRFPSWELARRARITSIEAAIRTGGLAHQKAIRIKKLLNEVFARRASLDLSFLSNVSVDVATAFLGSLPGVGPNTVACTLLFGCRHSVFPVDTHILRIGRRLGILRANCSDQEAHREFGALIPQDRCYEAHINLIKHGRAVCHPRNPRCDRCCLIDYCRHYSTEYGEY
jgi:endonuclease-3